MRFRVSLAQINPWSGDLERNCRRILQVIDEARRRECDLVVFPEMCLPGYCLDEKLLSNRHFLRENRRVLLERIRPATRGIAAVVGFVDSEEGRQGPDGRLVRFNAAAVLQDGRLLQVVHKRLLPAYRYFDDTRYFRPGREVEPVRVRTRQGEAAIGILICEDLWDEGYDLRPCDLYREKGVGYLFCINASPFVCSRAGKRDGKRFRREARLKEQVRRQGVPLVYVNTVGIGDNGKNVIPFDGFSQAFDRRERRVASLPLFEEAQHEVEFDDGEASPVAEPPFDREEEIYTALVTSVRDYYRKVGIFQRVLVAVSGGIDSALGTAIACDAMGPERVSAYNLPSRYNSPVTRRLAEQLARNLGVEYHVVPIQAMVERVAEDFARYLRPISRGETMENLQSRIRGLVMMAESNDRDGLLLTNGNETEIALGYATLYGDMVGGLSVIGDLPKPDVYRLARHVNRRGGREAIPEETFRIAASAELREDQVDPFDYPVVGPLVSAMVEQGLAPEELVERFLGGELEEGEFGGRLYRDYDPAGFKRLVDDLYRSLNRSVYKRLQGAPIIVVSERAFGFDLRETIINGWRGVSQEGSGREEGEAAPAPAQQGPPSENT